MMDIYLAIVQPDYENATILGAFSTLELAKLAFSDQNHEWYYAERYNQWWQSVGIIGFNDNEIHLLTLDRVDR